MIVDLKSKAGSWEINPYLLIQHCHKIPACVIKTIPVSWACKKHQQKCSFFSSRFTSLNNILAFTSIATRVQLRVNTATIQNSLCIVCVWVCETSISLRKCRPKLEFSPVNATTVRANAVTKLLTLLLCAKKGARREERHRGLPEQTEN